jgi:hypothetical protein
MKKRMVISHGDKGGTGKSTISSLVLEYALRSELRPYLIEGDSGIPDVAQRYREYVPGVRIPLQRADAADAAMVALFNELESLLAADEADVVILNLPAGASATIDTRAQEIIAPTVEAMGLELVTLYAIGPGQETVDAVAKSLEGGLCAISDQRIAVLNQYLGDAERYDWMRSPLREQWYQQGGDERRLPELLPGIRDKVRTLPGTLFQLAEGTAPGLTIVERSVLFRWLHAVEGIASLALGVRTSERRAA